MSTSISIRSYNVRFGDAILVSIGTGVSARHMLFDFGNAPGGVGNQGGVNDVFAPIAKDIRARTGGKLAVVVMTHEHLDHMEGFYSTKALFDKFAIDQVWMSIMSRPGYYSDFPKAKPQKAAVEALVGFTRRWNSTGRLAALPERFQRVIANNNVLDLTNKERIDYVRRLAKPTPKYLSRQTKPLAKHGLGSDVTVEILAPEQDASVYYPQKGGQLWLAAATRLGLPMKASSRKGRALRAPTNMAADEFAQLCDDVAELNVADVFAIDKAANNTSLVVRITVGGRVLMFCGDAEVESWRMMKTKGLLKPVDVLKVAHHGSVNGMPFEGADSVVADLLKPGKKTTAIVSTCRGAYAAKSHETEIPSPGLMKVLQQRCGRVIDTEHDANPGESVLL